MRVIVALHAGDVLAGVFDDGFRAGYTVLGPATNMLGRLEVSAKAADPSRAASEDFAHRHGSDGGGGLIRARLSSAQPGRPALLAVERTEQAGRPPQPYPLTISPHCCATSVPQGASGTAEVEFLGEPCTTRSE